MSLYENTTTASSTKTQRFAAEYVRMSTEHQKYSTENQSAAISDYADRRGIKIVRTYTDSGKSGLSLDGRDALKQLIADVESGAAEFTVILVYDVSRWGRFQDADESAYYEYICKRSGIVVLYCAEQFENDGSPVSTIVKGVKRAMAGEYSRELSVKVFAGQRRLIELGYRQGGPAGFGLRRQLLAEDGAWKDQLKVGQQKSIQTDRIVLVPGPTEEIRIVNWIYHLFVNDRKGEAEIAEALNRREIQTDMGRQWTRATVHQVLVNEKYIGNNVWNRVSHKLKGRRRVNPPFEWIRHDGAFDPVVDPALFQAAQARIRDRSRFFSDADLLDFLRGILDTQGHVSGLLIDEVELGPSSSTYRQRFGSLVRAYELIGYSSGRDFRYIEINRSLRKMYPALIEEAISGISQIGGQVHRDSGTDLLTVNEEFTASLCIVRCHDTPAGSFRWHIRFDMGLRPDITVAIRMNQTNSGILDYYLLPRFDMDALHVRLEESNGIALDAYQFCDLEALFFLAERSQLMELSQ